MKRQILIILKRTLHLFIASGLAAVLGSLASTQRVIGHLSDIGGATGFGDRVSMSVYDILYFGKLYWVFITIAFAIAFLAAGGLYRVTKFGRPVIYAAAGGIAMAVMLWAMEQVFFGVPIVAGARDGFGLMLQILAGALGGYVFALATKSRMTLSA